VEGLRIILYGCRKMQESSTHWCLSKLEERIVEDLPPTKIAEFSASLVLQWQASMEKLVSCFKRIIWRDWRYSCKYLCLWA
jgi:hypothetical protein